MKSIICRAYNKKEKKMYWFDVMWGDEHGNLWMLPEGERERKHGRQDNRIRVDPLGWKVFVRLSPYNPTHLDLGNEDCCGIFNGINDDGIVECNECAMTINDAIKQLTKKEEDCPVCHGQGATTDHHDPCTECGGSGKVGGEG